MLFSHLPKTLKVDVLEQSVKLSFAIIGCAGKPLIGALPRILKALVCEWVKSSILPTLRFSIKTVLSLS
jgi:hypothetical protein